MVIVGGVVVGVCGVWCKVRIVVSWWVVWLLWGVVLLSGVWGVVRVKEGVVLLGCVRRGVVVGVVLLSGCVGCCWGLRGVVIPVGVCGVLLG